MTKHLSILTALFFSLSGNAAAQTSASLTIRFENLALAKGSVRLALYRSAGDFLDVEKAELHHFAVTGKGSLNAQIKGLEPGTYAFASFHDENNDRALGTNLFGIPTEPYGFSRQCPSKWRPPSFDEAKFELKPGENEMIVPLQRWKL